MSERGTTSASFTEDARPRTQACAGADLDLDREQGSTPLLTNVADHFSTAPNDRSYAATPENPADRLREEIGRVRAAAAVDIENLQTDLVAKNRELGRLKAQLSEVIDEDSPEAATVKALLDLWWREVKDSQPRVKHDLKSTRAPKVRAAVKRRGVEICQKAILGVTYDDWAMGRVAKSAGKDFNDIAEHILHSDATIEKFAKLYDQHNVQREPESLERAFVRHVYGEDCELEYRPASKEPRHRPPSPGAPIDKVIGALRANGSDVVGYDGQPDQWSATCPAHDDRDPSLAIHRKPDGMILLHCFAGCTGDAIMDALGLQWADLWEFSERDSNAVNVSLERKKTIPAHLRHAMADLLARDERTAA